jgi:ubiquitin carboxyl-terminal hydrolase L5
MLHLQGVFTYLIESLGTKNVQFEELISLDSESLQQLNPIGVIFLFKYPTGEKQQKDKPQDGEFDFAAVEAQGEENVWFAAQTIQNACGTQALLSVLLNKDGSSEDGHVDIGPNLREFKEFTSGFPADVCWKSTALLLPIDMLTCYIQLRGEALSNSDLIRDTHNSFARSSPFVSDETRTATGDDDVYHFIAYTSINDTLYEIDGLQPAPIRHGDVGACPREIFADAVVPVLQTRIARYPQTEIRFNLLAMCEDLRTQAKAIGDQEMLEREERKRREWRWENALRRHNFVGFIGETMKGVTAATVKEGTYETWVEDAKATTQKRSDDRKRKGQGADEMDIE